MSNNSTAQQTDIDPRHTARALSLQQLFHFYSPKIDGLESSSFSTEELMEIYGQRKYSQELYDALVAGVKEHQPKIDEVIRELAPLWPIDQISLLDLVIIRIGIWESFVEKSVPEKVGIDEAIELAKEFSGETSAKFVNGVLGNLLQNEKLKAQLQS